MAVKVLVSKINFIFTITLSFVIKCMLPVKRLISADSFGKFWRIRVN